MTTHAVDEDPFAGSVDVAEAVMGCESGPKVLLLVCMRRTDFHGPRLSPSAGFPALGVAWFFVQEGIDLPVVVPVLRQPSFGNRSVSSGG